MLLYCKEQKLSTASAMIERPMVAWPTPQKLVI